MNIEQRMLEVTVVLDFLISLWLSKSDGEERLVVLLLTESLLGLEEVI